MRTIYERALEFVPEGSAVGLGSGRAATEFVRLLGERVRQGFKIRGGVPTSQATAELARSEGIPLLSLEQAMPLDIAVDGADEWDPRLNLIKGYGRAMVREKIIEAASRRLVILVGPGKAVRTLGERGKLPVEVVPLAAPLCRERLREFGWDPVLWTSPSGDPARTDNGNYILDCLIPSDAVIHEPLEVESRLQAIPGVVGTGLFIDMTDVLLVGDEDFDLLEERKRPS